MHTDPGHQHAEGSGTPSPAVDANSEPAAPDHGAQPATATSPGASPAATPRGFKMPAVAAAAAAGAVIVLAMLLPHLPGRTGDDARVSDVPAPSPSPVVRRDSDGGGALPWHPATEWTDGRRRSVAFELAAQDRVRVWMRHVRPVLVVRCLSRRIDAFVVTGGPASLEPGRLDHSVRVAFDGHDTQERWADADDHDALFAPDGATFVGRLPAARSLRFQFTPHNGEPVTAEFDLSGSAAVVAEVTRTCGSSGMRNAARGIRSER